MVDVVVVVVVVASGSVVVVAVVVVVGQYLHDVGQARFHAVQRGSAQGVALSAS